MLGRSARSASISSAGVRAGSDTEVSRRDVATAGSSGAPEVPGAEWPLGVSLSGSVEGDTDEGGSCASFLAFSFSRSMALSLAALGAAGKN